MQNSPAVVFPGPALGGAAGRAMAALPIPEWTVHEHITARDSDSLMDDQLMMIDAAADGGMDLRNGLIHDRRESMSHRRSSIQIEMMQQREDVQADVAAEFGDGSDGDGSGSGRPETPERSLSDRHLALVEAGAGGWGAATMHAPRGRSGSGNGCHCRWADGYPHMCDRDGGWDVQTDFSRIENDLSRDRAISHLEASEAWDECLLHSYFCMDDFAELRSSRPSDTMNHLDPDVLSHLFSFCDGVVLARVAAASRYMFSVVNGVSHRTRLWQSAYLSQWNSTNFTGADSMIDAVYDPAKDWRNMFAHRFTLEVRMFHQLCVATSHTLIFPHRPSRCVLAGELAVTFVRSNNSICVWNHRTQTVLWSQADASHQFRISGLRLVERRNRMFIVRDLFTGAVLNEIEGPNVVLFFDFDGRNIFCSLLQGEVQVLDIVSSQVRTLLTGGVARSLFSLNGFLAVAHQRSVLLFRISDLSHVLTYACEDRTILLTVRFDDQRMVAGCFNGTIHVWDFGTGMLKRRFRAHNTSIMGMHMAGWLLVTISKGERVRIHDIDSFRSISSFSNIPRPLRSVQFHVTSNADSKNCVASLEAAFVEGHMAGVRVWDFSTSSLKRDGSVVVVRPAAAAAGLQSSDSCPEPAVVEYKVFFHQLMLFSREFDRNRMGENPRLRDIVVYRNHLFQIHMMYWEPGKGGTAAVNRMASDVLRYLDCRLIPPTPLVHGAAVFYAEAREGTGFVHSQSMEELTPDEADLAVGLGMNPSLAPFPGQFKVVGLSQSELVQVFPVVGDEDFYLANPRDTHPLPRFALHDSLFSRDYGFVEFLLECNVDVNALELRCGWSPAHILAAMASSDADEAADSMAGTAHVLELLAKAGASMAVADCLGNTPLALAKLAGNRVIAEALLEQMSAALESSSSREDVAKVLPPSAAVRS